MDKNDIREQMEQELLVFANKFSVSRFKVSTPNFDLDYQRKDDGQLYLVSEKAVIRTLGKTTKVPIGEGQKFSTYEEAEDYVKKYWSEYYRKVRAKRSDKERLAEAKRQKRYRERRKAQKTELDRRQ